MDASLALPLIKALEAQKKKTGKQVYFIHARTLCSIITILLHPR